MLTRKSGMLASGLHASVKAGIISIIYCGGKLCERERWSGCLESPGGRTMGGAAGRCVVGMCHLSLRAIEGRGVRRRSSPIERPMGRTGCRLRCDGRRMHEVQEGLSKVNLPLVLFAGAEGGAREGRLAVD